MDEEILDGESKYGCRSGLRELDGEIDEWREVDGESWLERVDKDREGGWREID
jgi:hypothetical protein